MKVSNGVVKVGDLVSAESENGVIAEGCVFALQDYGHKEVIPNWEGNTVIIKDHETKEYSHWQPKNVTLLRSV